MPETAVVFLCNEKEMRQEQRGYARAFANHSRVIFFHPSRHAYYGDLNADLLSFLKQSSVKPRLILYPEVSPFLPWGLAEVEIPTACFHIDTYGFTEHRILWSMLFDYAFVFHFGFDKIFHQAGHPRTIVIAHAIDAPFFKELPNERIYEVGWVGSLNSYNYIRRRQVIQCLTERFQMNEWQRRYSYEEMAEVYKRSKIVVNISTDSYPQDANLRVFEAMAAGALLITGMPTDLSELGFKEGEHFIGYLNEKEITGLVTYYLAEEGKRQDIAKRGREEVLRQHTYAQRVETILSILDKDKGQLFAPARGYAQIKVRQIYFDYYISYSLFRNAIKQVCFFRELGYPVVLKALISLVKVLLRLLRMSIIGH